MRSLRGCFVLAMLACVASVAFAQEVAPGVHFTGQILVSVRGALTNEIPSAATAENPGGWTVRQLATVRGSSDLEGPAAAEPKTWLLLTPPSITEARGGDRTHPWDVSHRLIAGLMSDAMSEIPSVVDSDRIVEMEPVVAYEMRGISGRLAASAAKTPLLACEEGPAGLVIACGAASFQWPNVPRVSWHQDDDRTQLRKARMRAEKHFQSGDVVRIAHLDTGYYATNDSITPPRFDFALSRSLIPNDRCGPKGIDCYQGGLPNGHGPETLSVLAGGKVQFAGGAG